MSIQMILIAILVLCLVALYLALKKEKATVFKMSHELESARHQGEVEFEGLSKRIGLLTKERDELKSAVRELEEEVCDLERECDELRGRIDELTEAVDKTMLRIEDVVNHELLKATE